MATLKDISNKTGFSITTVSRALNGYYDVNEETRQIIMQAAEDLNYSPNILARNLVNQNSKTIGIIVNDLTQESAKDNFMFLTLCGVSDFLQQSDYEFVLLSTTTIKQKNKTYKQICSERQLAGVIFQGLKLDDPYLLEAQTSEIPCVLIDIPIQGKMIKYVTSNQVESVKHAIRYLHRLNHQKIAYVNGTENAHVSKSRKAGYLEALEELGLEVNPNYIVHGDFTEEGAKKAVLPLLLNAPEITAIFCASDVMALGVLQVTRELGIKVPDQLSIIGFDNILLSEYITPSLTTVAQFPYKMAKEATRMVIDLIEGNDNSNDFVEVKNELIIRQSTSFQSNEKRS